MGHNLCRHACVISEAEKKAVVELSYSRKRLLSRHLFQWDEKYGTVSVSPCSLTAGEKYGKVVPPNLAQALVHHPVSFYLGVAWI